MKPFIPVIVILAVILLALGVSMFTASIMESPRDQLYHQIDAKVAKAQRMLREFDPTGTRLLAAMGTSATQPAEVAADRWQEFIQQIEDSAIGEAIGKQNASLNALDAEYRKLGGENPRADHLDGSDQAYREFQARLKRNEQLITEAMHVISEALTMTEGQESGTSHPEATRMEAVLCYQQADLLRRQAAIHRGIADEARNQLGLLFRSLHVLDARIRSINADLAETATGGEAEVPPLAVRIKNLHTHRQEATADIEAAQKEADRLKAEIARLQEQTHTAQQQAREAEQRMFQLEEAGVDPTNPQAMKQFIDAYTDASSAHREAFREAMVLEHGALRNAHVDSPDEDKVLSDPLVAVDDGKKIEPERGLTALQADLKAAEAVIRTQQGVLKEIDRQSTELTRQRAELTELVSRLTKDRDSSRQQIENITREALAAIVEADRLETQALTLADGRGKLAADRAKRAAESRISEARGLRTEVDPESRNERLGLIANKEGFVGGHADALRADMDYVIAMIHAQRAEDLQRHAVMLDELEEAGVKVDAAALPESDTEVTASITTADGARAAMKEARKAGIAAAESALENLAQAAESLADSWVVHANIGAIHYLLANLSTGTEAEPHLAKAREAYGRSLRGRDDRPEAGIYKEIVAGLSPTEP